MPKVIALQTGRPLRLPDAPAGLTLAQQSGLDDLLVSITPVIDALRDGASNAALVPLYMSATSCSRATAYRDVPVLRTCLELNCFDALASQRKGKQRKVLGCEALIIRYYQRPGQPDAGDISFWLKQDHGLDVPRDWIRNYLKSLPSNLTETSPKRLGKHYYDQNIRPHHRRDLDDIAVGEIWVADGHRIKLVSRHPNSGDLFRVEVTPVLDKSSNYLYGFWVAANESALNTVYALCSVMARFGHVPTWFQTDPGPGFKNKRVQALLTMVGCRHMPTRGGNARGKDFGEGFFKIFNKRFSKQYDTFCGDDRTDDALARMRTKVKRGELYVPDLRELNTALDTFRAAYNAWPQNYSQRLKGKAPNDMIGQLKIKPLNMAVEDLLRPFTTAVVQQWEVRFRNRFYGGLGHSQMAAYEGRRVVVQYDEHDERQVWVRDAQHRLICVAQLVRKIGWLKDSIAADDRERSRLAAIARKQVQMDRVDQQFRDSALIAHAGEHGQPAALAMLARGHSFGHAPAPTDPLLDVPATPADQPSDWDDNWAAIQDAARQRLNDQI